MNPFHYDGMSVTIPNEIAMVFEELFLVILAVILVVALALWSLRSVGLYRVARRRGISHAWMAWIPIGSQWVLGSISDQYQHLIQDRVTSRRNVILALNVVGAAVGIGGGILMAAQMTAVQTNMGVMILDLGSMLVPLLTLGVSMVPLVFNHICSYDLYRSCKPGGAVMFLVLGIILPIMEPFFYFSCRKKDLGMVRKSARSGY